MKKILLIEDEPSVVSFVLKGLTEQGFEVTVALDGTRGLQLALSASFNLVLLDIMLPEKNGLDVCKKIRLQDRSIPILMLTALGTAENVVMGLEAGADDYLVKPFKFIELVARIRTLLRRTSGQLPNTTTQHIHEFTDIVVDDRAKTVKRGNTQVSLTSTEYRLLLMFLKNPRKVLSRTELLEEVWGVNFDMNTNVVDVYVNYLRKKLEVNNMPRVLHTVIGMGYVLKSE
jgi:two-component system, OmpR family, copper resistance phosphate regulon response regulator CusR